MSFLKKRKPGYALLNGRGIEIGAFEHPAPLPARCRVAYCDAITTEQAKQLFPEVDTSRFVKVSHLIDLNQTGLTGFADGSLDFVIFNHVIEHLVNPIFAVQEVLRVLAPDGFMVVAAPDKNHTFDRDRPLTTWEHLKADFDNRVTDSKLEDYLDVARYIHPHMLNEPPEELERHLARFKARREHLHVWTSETFKDFLSRTLKLLNVTASPIYETFATDNKFEYFGVWRKGVHPRATRWRRILRSVRRW